MLNNRVYDVLKYVAQILLPALGTLYFSLSQIWGLPKGEEVVGTITVVDTFLGVLLKLSSIQYDKSDKKYDGQINVEHDEDGETSNLNVKMSPDSIADKDEVLLKVKKPRKKIAK